MALPHFLSGPYEYTDRISRERKHTKIACFDLMEVVVHQDGVCEGVPAADHQGLV